MAHPYISHFTVRDPADLSHAAPRATMNLSVKISVGWETREKDRAIRIGIGPFARLRPRTISIAGPPPIRSDP